MDSHPWSDRAIRPRGDEEGSTYLRPLTDAEHDFDAPAWRRPHREASLRNLRRPAPRLIDLERRARFTRLPLDPRRAEKKADQETGAPI